MWGQRRDRLDARDLGAEVGPKRADNEIGHFLSIAYSAVFADRVEAHGRDSLL
jgi:hypothetical protein